jgi:hypothetical protein
MIGTLRKHNVWIWWVIIIATIVGFVYYLFPNRQFGGGSSGGGASANLGTVNGEAITQKEFAEAQREGRLFYFLRSGTWPDTEDKMRQVDNFAYQRLFLVSELNRMHIEVTPAAAAHVTKAMLRIPEDGPFPKAEFEKFIANEVMAKGNLLMEDFGRYVRHEAGQQLLISLFGMSGKLITTNEASFFYRREHEPTSVEVAFFPLTNYVAMATVTPQEISDFYNKQQAAYRLPERLQLDYVKFEATNYLSAADKDIGGITNLDERVEQTYLQAGPDAFTNELGKPLSADEAKAKIKHNLREGMALREARKAANDFLSKLATGHDKDHPITTADIEKAAKEENLTAKVTQPFDSRNPPAELDVVPRALRMVFALQPGAPDDQFTTLVGDEAVYVVGLNKRLPSEARPLDAVRDRVTEDYKEAKAMQMVKNAGQRLETAIRAGMEGGESFDALCAAQGIKPVSLPPFTMTTETLTNIDRPEFEHIQSTAYNLPTGKVSGFVESMGGGFIVYVKSRGEVDSAEMQKDLPTFLARLRDQRQQAAFSEWFGKQFQTHVTIPEAERNRLNGQPS